MWIIWTLIGCLNPPCKPESWTWVQLSNFLTWVWNPGDVPGFVKSGFVTRVAHPGFRYLRLLIEPSTWGLRTRVFNLGCAPRFLKLRFITRVPRLGDAKLGLESGLRTQVSGIRVCYLSSTSRFCRRGFVTWVTYPGGIYLGTTPGAYFSVTTPQVFPTHWRCIMILNFVHGKQNFAPPSNYGRGLRPWSM